MNAGLNFQRHEGHNIKVQETKLFVNRSAAEEIENNKWEGRKRLQSILRLGAIISLIGLMIVRLFL